MPAMNGNVGPDCDGSFMPTSPFHFDDSRSCQVDGGPAAFVLLKTPAAISVTPVGVQLLSAGRDCEPRLFHFTLGSKPFCSRPWVSRPANAVVPSPHGRPP